MKRMGILCCCILTLVLSSLPLRAQQPPAASPAASATSPDAAKAVADKLNQLDQRVTAAQSAADNAWMLVSAALVLMMTGPGLALFYGGLVRHKNRLAIIIQRLTGRKIPDAGFCRRHRGAHHLRRFRAGLCLVYGKTSRLSEAADASTQHGVELHRGVLAVGRLVRLQRWQRAVLRRPGKQRLCGHAFWSRCGSTKLERCGMAEERTRQRSWRNFGSSRGASGHHTGCGICRSALRARHRLRRGSLLLLDGHEIQSHVRIR